MNHYFRFSEYVCIFQAIIKDKILYFLDQITRYIIFVNIYLVYINIKN